jgi:hypothetical protein
MIPEGLVTEWEKRRRETDMLFAAFALLLCAFA